MTGKENQIFILRTPAATKFFHQILKKSHFGVKKIHDPPRWICMTHIWSPTLFSRTIIIFQGVLTKFVNLMKDLKYEHQSTFSLWEGSNLILRTGTELQQQSIFVIKFSKNDTLV